MCLNHKVISIVLSYKKISFWAILLLLVISSFLALCMGVMDIPVENIFKILQCKLLGDPIPDSYRLHSITIWELRLPRIVMSLLAGASLALCGAAFQSIFRNPICDPYILGISSGASLGAAIAIITGIDAYLFGITGMALITALITLGGVIAIASIGRKKAMETILLAGLAINFLVSSIVTLLMVSHQESLDKIIFWTMGSFTSATWEKDGILLLVFIVITFILYFYAKSLNIIQLDEEIAQTSGIRSQRVRIYVLLFASILIAITVAFCGVIGFIGLIIPHMVRMIFGNDNRTLFTYSLLLGSLFCLFSDTIARCVSAPSELPVGCITALAGVPYFIFLLLKRGSFSK